jgi:pimeloyl-ACP methyl ester carboxylesterase
MAPPPIQYATASDGVRIAYVSVGEGAPLVFASNIFGDATRYLKENAHVREVTDRLARLGWRVIRYDHRGMGASDRDVGDVGLEARVRDLSAVVDHLGLDHFALGAVDIGATTAIAYAVAHPAGVVSRLALVSPWASGERYPAVAGVAGGLLRPGERRTGMEAVREHSRERGFRIQGPRLRANGNGVPSADNLASSVVRLQCGDCGHRHHRSPASGRVADPRDA